MLDETVTYELYDDLEDINLKYVGMSHDQGIDSLTTVLGIKSNNGVLLTSDSKVSNEYVKDRVSKIFRINRSMGVGVSGDLAYIRILVDKLTQSLAKKQTFTELTLRHKIDDEVVDEFLNLNPRPTMAELQLIIRPPGLVLGINSRNKYTRRGYVPDPQKPGFMKYDDEEYLKIVNMEAQIRLEIMKQIIQKRSR